MIHLLRSLRCLTLWLCAVLTLMLGGCRSSRSISQSQTGLPVTSGELPQRLAAVEDACREWQSVKLPVSIKLASPAKITLGGNAVMERGRGLSLSLRFMGMVEVGSLTVVSDTVIVVDKYHKAYLKESVADLLRSLPLTIDDAQNLLLGQPFVIGGDLSQARLSVADGDNWVLTPPSVAGDWAYSFIFDADNMLRSVGLSRSGKSAGEVSYGDIVTGTPAGPVAGKTTLSIPGKQPVEATVAWRVNRAEWDRSHVTAPTVPRDYRRVTPAMVAALLAGF